MSEEIKQRLLARIGRRDGRSSWPWAVNMEPEVRTPIDIVPIRQPHGALHRTFTALDDKDTPPYLFEWQYNVRLASIDAFHNWLGIYERDLRDLCPKHFRYLGTFQALFGPSKPSGGRYRTFWQHADLAGLHLLRSNKKDLSEDAKDNEEKFIKLLTELISFQDTRELSARSSQLYQLVGLAENPDA